MVGARSNRREYFVVVDMDEDHFPTVFGSSEDFMEEVQTLPPGVRRNEDIALDMMKFIAITTSYGRTSSSGVGFQGSATAKPEEYVAHLLELYGRCLEAVRGKK